MMNVAITGASGMLGSHLLDVFENTVENVHNMRLLHQFDEISPESIRRFLEEKDIDVIVNCAAVRNPNNEKEFSVNAALPKILYQELHKTKKEFKFVHISSINVLLESRQDSYSISKREAEQNLAETSSIIIRPNLIWSHVDEGDRKRLKDYIMKVPIAPVPYPGHTYWPVAVDSLARYVKELVVDGQSGITCNVSGPVSKTIWQLAKEMAKERGRIIIPIPTAVLERISIRKILPVSLRSTDTSDYDYTLARREDLRVVIP